MFASPGTAPGYPCGPGVARNPTHGHTQVSGFTQHVIRTPHPTPIRRVPKLLTPRSALTENQSRASSLDVGQGEVSCRTVPHFPGHGPAFKGPGTGRWPSLPGPSPTPQLGLCTVPHPSSLPRISPEELEAPSCPKNDRRGGQVPISCARTTSAQGGHQRSALWGQDPRPPRGREIPSRRTAVPTCVHTRHAAGHPPHSPASTAGWQQAASSCKLNKTTFLSVG